ncbi:hypothetical protein Gotri_025712, partial [Gossypium trilobum]|nr:hypothetical protein [Gossypium trilobum]
REKRDSLAEGYVSELWDYTRISVTQNILQELKEIWDQWNNEARQLFYSNYGDLPLLLDMKVDKHLFLSSCPVLESCLQLLHIRESRFGAYSRRILDFTSVFEDSSGQSLLESCKCTDLFKEADEYNGDDAPRYEEEGRCLFFEYIWFGCLP